MGDPVQRPTAVIRPYPRWIPALAFIVAIAAMTHASSRRIDDGRDNVVIRLRLNGRTFARFEFTWSGDLDNGEVRR